MDGRDKPGLTGKADHDATPSAPGGRNFAHRGDEIGLGHGELRLGLLLQIFVAVLDGGEGGAKREVLDLHFAFSLLVAALDDDARRGALVGIFHLRLHAGLAEIKLGADAGVAQGLHQALIVGHAVAIEHQHDDGAAHRIAFELAESLEAEEQSRDADGDAGGRHFLAGEALDQSVIASAETDRAKPDRLPALVLHRRQQLRLEHWAGVILEAAHDGGIDTDSLIVAS